MPLKACPHATPFTIITAANSQRLAFLLHRGEKIHLA
jgi:hypothetical protein